MTTVGLRYEQERRQYGDYRVAVAYVQLVKKKMLEEGVSEETACRKVGIDMDTYLIAKSLVEKMTGIGDRKKGFFC